MTSQANLPARQAPAGAAENFVLVEAPANGGGSQDDSFALFEFDLLDIWSAVYRSRWWVAGITGFCVLAALVFSLLTTPIYRSVATVQIEQQAAQVTGTEEQQPNTSGLEAERFLQTELDIVRSRRVARLVAEDTGVFGNEIFLEAMDESVDPISIPGLSVEEAQEEKVINILQDNLDVSIPPDSRLAQLAFESPDPQLSARIANSFAENYIRGNLQRKFDTSSYAREFLAQRLDEVRGELEEAERAALEYAKDTQIVSAPGQGTITAASLSQLNEQFSRAQAERIAAEQKWRRAQQTTPLAIPEVLRNSAIQALLQDRANLMAEQEEQLQRRRENFPSVQQTNAQIEEINSQIDDIATAIRSSIRNEYASALGEEQQLAQRIAQLRDATLAEQTQAVELGILQRSADTNRQLYQQLLRRLNELNAEAGIQSNNLSLVDRAVVPRFPVSPNLPLNLALALVFGVLLSAIYVFLKTQLIDVIRTPEEVKSKLGLPLLGVIPMIDSDSIEYMEMLQDVKEPLTEAYATTRTALSLSSASGIPQTLAFTSTQASEGKSSTCLAIGMGAAKIGKRVLIIDADLRRPNQHTLIGLDNEHGLSDVLAGNGNAEAYIQRTPIANMDFIASGGRPPAPTELISSPAFMVMLEQMKEKYDIILLDSPPLLGLADALLLASLAENIVYTIESGRNRAASVRNSIEKLHQSGATISGVILTKFDSSESGYAYDASGAYSYSY